MRSSNIQSRYDEPQYLADIEEHLGVTIQQADTDMKVKADEFDGKVVYGEKKKEGGAGYAGHRSELAPTLATLTSLETQVTLLSLSSITVLLFSIFQAQHLFLTTFYKCEGLA